MNEWMEINEEKQKSKALFWHRLANILWMLTIVAVPLLFLKWSFTLIDSSDPESFISFAQWIGTEEAGAIVGGVVFYCAAILGGFCSVIYIVMRFMGYDIGLKKDHIWKLPNHE